MVFEGSFEFLYEIFEGSHGYGGSSDGPLSKDSSPGLDGSFGHVGEGEGDLLGAGVVYRIVYFEIEENQGQP